MNTETNSTLEADASSDDDLVNIYSDMDVESISDEDEHARDEDEGMFDIFTGEVQSQSQGRSDTLNSSVYHQDLEREFGEGSRIVTVTNSDHLDYYRDFGPDEVDPIVTDAPKFKKRKRKRKAAEPAVDPSKQVVERPKIELVVRNKAPKAETRESHTVPTGSSEPDQLFAYDVPAIADDARSELTSLQDFAYTQLEGPRRIRVLNILPARQYSDPIECRVVLLDLPNSTSPPDVPYQTISYAWGQHSADGPHTSHSIKCGNARVDITANLHRVLKIVRSHLDSGRLTIYGKRPCIWADAICINQKDANERNSQVELMSQIYGRASRVLVWLEDMQEDSESYLQELLETQKNADLEHTTWLTGKGKLILEDLLNRPWFHRRWTIQEFALQRVRTILCGRLAIEFAPFRTLLCNYQMEDQAGPMSYARLWNGIRTKRWLLVNLHRFSGMQCTLPHDLVYALISISCGCSGPKASCGELNCGQRHFKIDYNKPIAELLLDLGRQFARTDVASVLACAAMRQDRPYSPWASRLPSWCPDWRLSPNGCTPELRYFITECFQEGDTSHKTASLEYLEARYEYMQGPVNYSYPKPIFRRSALQVGEKMCLKGWLFRKAPKGLHDTPYATQLVPLANNEQQVSKDSSVDETEVKEEVFRSARSMGEWPGLEHDQVFCLLPWCRLALILQHQKDDEYLLVSCFRRPIVLEGGNNRQFSWVSSGNDKVWVRGCLVQDMLIDFGIV